MVQQLEVPQQVAVPHTASDLHGRADRPLMQPTHPRDHRRAGGGFLQPPKGDHKWQEHAQHLKERSNLLGDHRRRLPENGGPALPPSPRRARRVATVMVVDDTGNPVAAPHPPVGKASATHTPALSCVACTLLPNR